MANVTLMGASYTDVPAIDLPQTGGGTVRFYENGGGMTVTDVVNSTGTGSVVTGDAAVLATKEITANGTYNAEDDNADGYSSVTVNVTNQDYNDALTAFGVQSNLANGITALTTYANEITGESDTNLSDAVRSLADGYGQGGSSLTKLGTIEISENTRSMSVVPQSNWFDYDFLIVKYDLTLSASDWLYASTTNLKTSGTNTYSTKSALTYKYVGAVELNSSDGSCIFLMPNFVANGAKVTVSSGQTLYLYTYSSSKTILSGSSVTIYGGNMSDLL